MASNSGATTLHSPPYGSDPTTPNTTFVQADPSNFRAVVQKLTGASEDPSAQKLPLTLPSRLAAQNHRLTAATTAAAAEVIGPKKPNFKLHERRNAAAKKLELSIGVSERPMMMMFNSNNNNINTNMNMSPCSYVRSRALMGETMLMASPVSPLEVLARGSPRTPISPHEEEEERAIAEKGFYLHPSPLSTPRASQPPELLPLFPLHSPTHKNTTSS
ncbi:VQ motif-containing protein 11 isoform X1 [Gastrolobium bilobum]|uniref:VQ motif-containing protein 11 isoform X1 n=1 Tax=Gastrolobium bilobum TaxID=150636 RepID=UPI002AB14DF5|nr:VQ motif-containing protein 11 isoform X1 [Gastrolobium bilobum]